MDNKLSEKAAWLVARLQQQFHLPVFSNEEQARVADILDYISRVLLSCALVYGLVSWLGTGQLLQAGLAGTVVAGMICLRMLLGRNQLRLAVALFLVLAWGIIVMIIVSSGGTGTPTYGAGFLIPVIIATFLLKRRGLTLYAGGIILTGLALAYAEMQAFLPTPTLGRNSFDHWIEQTLNILVAIAILRLATHGLNRALKRSQENERALVAINQEVAQREKALRQSEEHFRNLVEGSIQGIYVHRDGRPLFVNHAFARMHGYESPEEVLALGSLIETVAPSERERLVAYREARKRGGDAPSRYYYEALRKDGSIMIVDNVGRVINWQGRSALQGTIIDVTAQRQAELRLQQYSERISGILNALPAHIALLDETGQILEVNEAWKQFAVANDLPHENFCVGQNYLAVCDAAQGDFGAEARLVAKGIREVLAGEMETFSLEYSCHSLTETRWFEVVVTSLVKGAGGAVVMHLNITARKGVEIALRDSSEWLQMVNDLNQALLAARSSDEVARVGLIRIRQLIPCPSLSVRLFDFSRNEATILVNLTDGETHLKAGQTFLLDLEFVDTLRQGPVQIVDNLLELVTTCPYINILQAEGLRSMMRLPLISQDGLIGALNLFAYEPAFFNETHREKVQGIIAPLALALQQARLYEQGQQHARLLESRVQERTAELRQMVNLMAGREIRMAELKNINHRLQEQLAEAGLTPMVDDSLSQSQLWPLKGKDHVP
jgi:PAS domain S-box-containing protein